MKAGDKWNWKHDPKTQLIYLGKDGAWHQFAKVDVPNEVWCEVLESDLHMLEATPS